MIEAAGGVVWRPGPAGSIEIAVIHRPRRRDWSLPKGKREHDESLLECAVREVREETGFDCEVGHVVTTAEHRHRSGRRKVIRYWAMRAVDGSFLPSDEVDELRWVSVAEARTVLTRSRDVAVVHRFAMSVDTVLDGVLDTLLDTVPSDGLVDVLTGRSTADLDAAR
jgi:8-oxo-dGTP pyrophosphatase MutT (NUDIX family)